MLDRFDIVRAVLEADTGDRVSPIARFLSGEGWAPVMQVYDTAALDTIAHETFGSYCDMREDYDWSPAHMHPSSVPPVEGADEEEQLDMAFEQEQLEFQQQLKAYRESLAEFDFFWREYVETLLQFGEYYVDPWMHIIIDANPNGKGAFKCSDSEFARITSMLRAKQWSSRYSTSRPSSGERDDTLAYADYDRHIFRYRDDSDDKVPKYSLDQKREHAVYETDEYIFLKLPTDENFIRREGKSMSHPVAGDTKVVTYDGLFPIRDLVGKPLKLLTRRNVGEVGWPHTCWEDATVQGYGVQPVMAITLERSGVTKVIRATPDHRWYAFNNTRNKQYLRLQEKVTSTLEVGNRIPSVHATRTAFRSERNTGIHLSPVGVMHGVIFGDGSIEGNNQNDTVRGSYVNLYGKKDAELLEWFSPKSDTKVVERSIGGIRVNGMPRAFKSLPDPNESPAYLLGWLAGYYAADGHVSTNGCGNIHSATLEHLQFAEMLCQRFGIRTRDIAYHDRVGFGQMRRIYRLPFEAGCLPKDFYLIQAHRDRVKERHQEASCWTVKSVVPDGEAEVFCAVVPATGVFVLEGNILTGNCLSTAYSDYCARMKAGQIEVYSQTRKADNTPVIDIEVALTKSSYGGPVEHPSVTQIRGVANECPPKDEYLPALMEFFENYGKPRSWAVTNHGTRNFDGRTDGDAVTARWNQIKDKQA